MTLEGPTYRIPHPDMEGVVFGSDNDRRRAAELIALQRFSGSEMTQRTTVADHSLRSLAMTTVVTESLLHAGIKVDQRKAMFWADHHDDSERKDPRGDIPTSEKMQWSPEEREEFDKREIENVRIIEEEGIEKPSWVGSLEDMFVEHGKREGLEVQVVNYVDKWDGMNETVHELICGDNDEEFREILERYRGILVGLEEENSDWLPIVREFLPSGVFDVPKSDSLKKKKISDLDFTSARSLTRSLCADNPPTYSYWIKINWAAHGLWFLEHTFPGWVEQFPPNIMSAIRTIEQGRDPSRTPSGLIIASSEVISAVRFVSSIGELSFSRMMLALEIEGEIYRARTGRTRALVGDALGLTSFPRPQLRPSTE